MRLAVTLALLVSSTAWADFQAVCVRGNVPIDRAHWVGPIRQRRAAALRDADAHLRRHPKHSTRVVRVEKDAPDDGVGPGFQ